VFGGYAPDVASLRGTLFSALTQITGILEVCQKWEAARQELCKTDMRLRRQRAHTMGIRALRFRVIYCRSASHRKVESNRLTGAVSGNDWSLIRKPHRTKFTVAV